MSLVDRTEPVRDAKAQATSHRVLLIEDNPDSRETLRRLMEIWGHEVQVAEDGRQGVRLGLAWGPAVAIIDIGLPILDGYDVAQRLRSAFGRRIFLIALTAYSQPIDRQLALSVGFDVHMTKPADLDELHRLLEQVPTSQPEEGA